MVVGGTPFPVPAGIVARRLLGVATADEDLTGGSAVLQRACRATAAGLAVRGCAIHLVSPRGESGIAAWSDPWSARIADLAFTLGEGPSLDAFARRRPVLVSDLGREAHRWQGFAQTAIEMGLYAVFCFPLQVGGMALGILDVYGGEPRRLDDLEVELALAFTDLATATLLGDSDAPADVPWEPLLDHRAEIHQAQGMVMVDLGVSLAESLVRMRAHAFTEGIPLLELAQAILRGQMLPAAADEEQT